MAHVCASGRSPYYRENEETFHRLLKNSSLDSNNFQISILGVADDVQPISELMVDKIKGRREKHLSQELLDEKPIKHMDHPVAHRR